MAEKARTKSWLIVVLLLVVAIPVSWFLLALLEGRAPEIIIQPVLTSLGEKQTLTVTATDAGSGLKKIRVEIEKDGKTFPLAMETFPSKGFGRGGSVASSSIDVFIEPRVLGLGDGKAVLRLEARDYAWRKWWHGNQKLMETTVLIDTHPPKVDVLTRFHYVNQGGVGLVIYKLSEPCPTTGVRVGDDFYPGMPGHFKNPNIMMSFFAVAHNQGSKTKISIESTDLGGNTTRTGFSIGIRGKRFRTDVIGISDGFLAQKMPEFDLEGVPEGSLTPVEKYIKVNQELRIINDNRLKELAKQTENVLQWDLAPFLRFPGSARRASFADNRIYQYNGQKIDQQFHMGVDLASVEQAPIPAGNAGKVVFTGIEGIYGQTVVIDHGFGLFSLYSHLSRIDTQVGETVSRGDTIGRTGMTGMAAGDHLHYAMMVHHTFVNPEEWWDPHWIEDNITAKINSVKSEWDRGAEPVPENLKK